MPQEIKITSRRSAATCLSDANQRHLRSNRSGLAGGAFTPRGSWVCDGGLDFQQGASEARHDTGGPVKRLTLDEMYAHAETVAKAARSAETNPRQQRDRRLIAKEMMRIINERRGHERTA